jgi:hypothetical protein
MANQQGSGVSRFAGVRQREPGEGGKGVLTQPRRGASRPLSAQGLRTVNEGQYGQNQTAGRQAPGRVARTTRQKSQKLAGVARARTNPGSTRRAPAAAAILDSIYNRAYGGGGNRFAPASRATRGVQFPNGPDFSSWGRGAGELFSELNPVDKLYKSIGTRLRNLP